MSPRLIVFELYRIIFFFIPVNFDHNTYKLNIQIKMKVKQKNM